MAFSFVAAVVVASAFASQSLVAAAEAPPFNGAHLFPIPILEGWSNAPDSVAISATSSKPVTRFSLNDTKTLHITNKGWSLPEMQDAPDGTPAYVAFYPKNSYSRSVDPGKGGFGYNFDGPVDITNTDHMLFSYAVYFEEGFDFVMGGKLPGPAGGSDAALAASCTGGQQNNRDSCWSTRLMWRTDGEGEIYIYAPLSNEPVMMGLEGSEPDATIYGFSLARGAFTFARGGWTVVAQRVQLNDYGKSNGELELWVNGKSVIHSTGLVLRANPKTQIRGIIAQTFFGGSNETWESTKDQSMWLSGYSLATLAPGASSAQGHAAYPIRVTPTGTTGPAKETDAPDAAWLLQTTSLAIVLALGVSLLSWM